MFISREYDYALRTLRTLADGEQLTVSQICKKEHIPQPYAYKILKKLEKASILQGYRGTNGGYRLIAPLESVTMYDVYIAIEEKIYINECMREGYHCPNNIGEDQCKMHKELCNIQEDFIQCLIRRSLKDIFDA